MEIQCIFVSGLAIGKAGKLFSVSKNKLNLEASLIHVKYILMH